jgi:hypothetical protein
MDKFLWTQRSNFGPAARSRHALAYDSNRARTAMFGGSANDVVFSDTWEWDGFYWTQMDDIGPGSRVDHAMAFDDARNVALLFGGIPSGDVTGSPFSDTWQWDGGDWTQLSRSGPSARSGHAMAFDSNRKVAVLFGGIDSTGAGLADTWEFDGQDWTQQEDAGPQGRAGAAMTFDAAGLRVILFGGSGAIAGQVAFGDTWAWDGKTWVQIADFGPPGRSAFGMVSMGDGIALFGGAPQFGDTWEFDGKHWTQRQDIGPGPRSGHAMAFDIVRSRIVLFGGLTTGTNVVGDTWEHAEVPPPLSVASLQIFPEPGVLTVAASFSLTGAAPPGGVTVQLGFQDPGGLHALAVVSVPAGATNDATQFEPVTSGQVVYYAQIPGTPPVTTVFTPS